MMGKKIALGSKNFVYNVNRKTNIISTTKTLPITLIAKTEIESEASPKILYLMVKYEVKK